MPQAPWVTQPLLFQAWGRKPLSPKTSADQTSGEKKLRYFVALRNKLPNGDRSIREDDRYRTSFALEAEGEAASLPAQSPPGNMTMNVGAEVSSVSPLAARVRAPLMSGALEHTAT
jgi:hypothetical protein